MKVRLSIICAIAAILMSFQGWSQVDDVAKLLGGVGGDASSHGVVTDPNGNVYMKGSFDGSLKIGAAYYRATNDGIDDFICKNDVNGNLQWFKQIGFEESELAGRIGDIAIDAMDNIYIIGSFTLDADIEGNVLTNNGSKDVYLAKYDKDGVLQFVKNVGGSGDDYGNTIEVDAAGNLFIGGSTNSPSIDFNGTNVKPGGGTRVAFVARYDNAGNEDWFNFIGAGGTEDAVYDMTGKSGGDLHVVGTLGNKAMYASYFVATGGENWLIQSTGTSRGELIGVDYDGFMYITGWFDAADFNLNGETVTGYGGGKDIIVGEVDPSDGALTMTTYGGSLSEQGTAIAFYSSPSEIFVTGDYFSSDLNFTGSNLPTPGGFSYPFILRTNSSFTPIEARNLSTGFLDSSTGIAVDGVFNNLIVSGYFAGISDFDILQINNEYQSFFIGSFSTTDLSTNWVAASPKGEIVGTEIVVDNSDNVIVSGFFSGTVDLFSTRLVSRDDPPFGDKFVAKFNNNGDLVWVQIVACDQFDEILDLAVDGNGTIYLHADFSNIPTISGTTLSAAETGNVLVQLDPNGNFQAALPIPSDGFITSIVGDPVGSELWAAGSFTGTFDVAGNVLTADGGDDIFLIRFVPNLVVGGIRAITSVSTPNVASESAIDIFKVPGGDLFMTGDLSGDIDFGSGFSFSPAEPPEVFVASFNALLATTNAWIGGGTDVQQAGEIAVDGSGNVYITGEYENQATFGGVNILPAAPKGFFLVQYNSSGVAQWGKAINRVNLDGNGRVEHLAVDTDGNSFISGYMQDGDGMEDGSLDVDGNLVTYEGTEDALLAMFQSDGTFNFAVPYGSKWFNQNEFFVGREYGRGIATDSNKDLWFIGSLTVDVADFGNNQLQPYGSQLGIKTGQDGYLLKILPLGGGGGQQKMYWTNPPTQINRANLDGSNSENFYTGGGNQQGVVIDLNNDVIYWCDKNNDEIWKADMADPNGTKQLLFGPSDGIDEPMGIAVDSDVNNRIYWAEKGINNRIASADLDGGNPNFTFITGLTSPHDVEVVPSQDQIFFSDLNLLRQADLSTGLNLQTVYDYGTGQILGIDVDVVNNFIYWVGDGSVDGATLAQAYPLALINYSISNSGFTDFDGHDVEVDPDGGFVYHISTDDKQLITYPLDLSIASISTDLDGGTNVLFNDPQFLELDLRMGPVPVVEVFPNGNLTRCIADPPTTITATLGEAYQWFNGATPIAGATDQTFTTTTSGDFSVEVTIGGVPYLSSNSLNVTAESNPEITASPVDVTNCAGGSASFTVIPDTVSPGFQWLESTDGGSIFSPLSDGGVYSGTAAATLSISDVTGKDGFIYKVEVIALTTSLLCSIESGTALLTVTSAATANAGADISVCDTSPVALNGTVGSGATGGSWTTAGDGTFDNTSSLTAIYTPGTADIANGSVVLTLTTTGPCTQGSDNVTLNFGSPPTADAGTDILVCQGNTVQLNGSIGGSATSLTWTTAGDGAFDDAASTTAIYTPGPGDIAAGTVDLTLTTDDPDGAGNCQADSDALTVTIEVNPTIDAGSDITVTNDSPVNLAATGTGISASTWFSPTNGAFGDPTALITTYTPTPADLSNGSVQLQITGSTGGTCNDAVDFVNITFDLVIAVADINEAVDVGTTSEIDVASAVTGNISQGFTTTITQLPSRGSASVLANQNVEYIASNSETGTDLITIQVCNPFGFCDTGDINITLNNNPPVIDPEDEVVEPGGVATIDLTALISDPEGNIDFSTLAIVSQPTSGAPASIDANGILTVDYTGLTFTGTDRLTIRVCDFSGECVDAELQILVGNPDEVIILNAVSPNGDGKNDFMKLINIEFFPDNEIQIYNRMGNRIYDTSAYDNINNNFKGIDNNGNQVPNGTYYYTLKYRNSVSGETKTSSGFLVLQR